MVLGLGKMKTSVTLDENLWKHFQMTAINIYGTKRGAISKALEEAIGDWTEKNGRVYQDSKHTESEK